MTPPRIRTRSGRRPRARFHASWSPASRTRARRTLIRLLGVAVGLLLLRGLGVNVHAASSLASLPYDRKLKEIVLAYQLSKTYTKHQILQLYLNESYYGEQQYGVQAAAQTYFHKDARTVDLAQASMLAGLPQAPDSYSPIAHFDLA